ncbi:MAG: group II intron reverse transcriptase/maturase [Chitinophagales bacterium]
MVKTKSQPITKQMVWAAYKRVKTNQGGSGVDGMSLSDLETDLSNQLYKLWNRLSSGSYFPPPVKEVEIPKGNGKTRKLGIPTVLDRIAQQVVKDHLEPKIEPCFHNSSYGYRPNRSAHAAIGVAKEHCWRLDWVIDLDIKGFFDELNHELLFKALYRHTDEKWVLMYIDRWLKASVITKDGTKRERTKGTPQGGVISPLLANLYLHYGFDKWMEKQFPSLSFERYADDIIVHCQSERQAEYVLSQIRERLQACKLELHPDKTKIVYCRDSNRKQSTDKPMQFTFLGYDFKARKSKNSRDNRVFYSFTPAISNKAKQRIIKELRQLGIQRRTGTTIYGLAKMLNRKLEGWINYYGRYRKSVMWKIFSVLNIRLIRWARNTYKRFKGSWRKAHKALKQLQKRQPNLFVHWRHGYTI